MTTNEFYESVRDRIGSHKHCTSCNEEHPIEQFPIKNRREGRLHARCKNSQRVASQADYAKNRNKRKTQTAEYRAALRAEVNALVDEWLAGRRCQDCDGTERLVAVAADGRNVRSLSKKGFRGDDISRLLTDASVGCLACRSNTFRC